MRKYTYVSEQREDHGVKRRATFARSGDTAAATAYRVAVEASILGGRRQMPRRDVCNTAAHHRIVAADGAVIDRAARQRRAGAAADSVTVQALVLRRSVPSVTIGAPQTRAPVFDFVGGGGGSGGGCYAV